jgi:hypothetical protein
MECGDARITRSLHAVLTELAEPLMRAGVTPRLFGELAARAFVMAACKASTLRNGRINQSRVAVLTGLSRAEVRNVMRGARNAKAHFRPRTQRVIDGWLSDARYLVGARAPRPVRVSGSAISFAALVKKYAGDVPHHAVLQELRRRKLVKEDGERIQLLASAASASRPVGKTLEFLLALLSDGIAVSATKTAGPAQGVHRLTLRATDGRDSIALYQRAVTSAASFVSGLDQSLRVSPARNSKRSGSQVTVSVLVRLKESHAKMRRQRNVRARD